MFKITDTAAVCDAAIGCDIFRTREETFTPNSNKPDV